jgi:opacity protein-like surface antigen
MNVRKLAVLAVVVAVAGQTAAAQRMTPSPFKFTVFAGVDIPTGDGSDEVKTGYTAGVAVDYRMPATPLGFRAEGLYANFSSNQSVAGFDGSFSDLGVNANAVIWFPMGPASTVSPYITGGPSFSRVKAEAKSGSTTISTTDNRWGFNVGGGIEFGLGDLGARADVRYKRISLDGGDSYGSIPITFGIRF